MTWLSGSWVEPAIDFALQMSTTADDSNGCFQVIALANDLTHLRP